MEILVKKIIKILIKKNLKISFAESCTGGMLSSKFTSINGSSKVFELALITYSNQSKSSLLKVPKKIIKKYGSVSKECCLAMVNKISKISKSDISVSITGIAGPSGGSKKKPIGLVYIGFKKGNLITSHIFFFKNKTRIQIQKAAVKKALEIILNSLK
jgi:nicotinamide-nucleotide amidase